MIGTLPAGSARKSAENIPGQRARAVLKDASMNVKYARASLLAGLGLLTACSTAADPGRNAPDGSSADSSFPSAVYSGCTLYANAGGVLIGYLEASALSLTTSGSSVTARFGTEGDAGPVGTVELVSTSSTSATLGAAGQGFAGIWGSCGGGAVLLDSGTYVVADPLPALADLELTAASAVAVNGVAFLTLTGTVGDVDGGPGCAADTPPTGPTNIMAMCLQSPGSGSIAAVPTTAATGAGFVPGSYQCYGETERVSPHDSSGSNNEGQLVLARSGSSGLLSATYTADWVAGSSVTFTPTSDTTAVAASSPLASLGCESDRGTDSALDVIAAAMTATGSTLFVGVTVDTGSGACPGQTSTTTLACTPTTP